MSNYTPSGNPLAQTRGVSSLIRTEFTNIQTAVNSKGDVTGQTWSGAHDFTGATVTAATQNAGDSSTKVATTAYVATSYAPINSPTFTGAVTIPSGANIAGYAPLSSPAFTGTPTAPTAALGTNTNQIATMAALVNQAFSSSLPAISAGVTDYFTTNNGSTGSWSNLLKAGTIRFADSTDTTKRIAFNAASITTGTTRTITMPDRDITLGGIGVINSTITTSTTLSGQDLYVPVAMTALGQSITLPNATTVSLGGPHYIIDNSKGTYPAGIRDNTDTLLMAIAAGGEALVSLKDNTTQAGVWSITGTNLEPGLITIDNTFSSTYSSTVLAPFVALDSNTSIHFAALSSGFAAFVVDNTGKVLTTPVTVDSTASSTPKTVFKVDATHAIVFYGSSTTTNSCVVLTLSGSSPSYSLAIGTPQTYATALGSNWDGENFINAPKIAQLSGSLYVASNVNGTNTSVIAISVSGAAITIGGAANIITSSSVAGSTTTYALTATTALVLYKSGASAPYANNGVVISVSGTTCTVGTPAAATGCQSSQTTPSSSAFLSATKIAIADDNNTTQVTVSGFTVSGTTVTAWTALNVETGLATNLVEYATNNATRYNAHLWALGANTAGLWYLDGSGVSRAVVISESNGTLTAGSKLFASFSQGAQNANRGGQVMAQGTSEFLALMMYGANNAWKFMAIPHKISGTSVTNGDAAFAIELSSVNLLSQLNATKLSQGDYLIFGAEAALIPVFRTNGDVLNKRGSISIPNLVTGVAYPLQTVSSSRIMLIDGSTGTTVGASTYQLRLLNIEVAA